MKKVQTAFQGERIWIIGASSGIGKALAQCLDEVGAELILSSRRQSVLEAMATELLGSPEIIDFDVSNPSAFTAAFEKATHKPVDRIIYLPAMYEPMLTKDLKRDSVEKTILLNLTAVFYLLESVLPYFKEHHCQLAVTASVAGYVGLPKAQPYGCTKAAVINLMESVKAEHPDANIKLINPGFVKTRLTDKNDFQMPMIQTPKQAASAIAEGLLKKAFEIHFPKRFTRSLKCLRALPYGLYFKLMAKRGN